MRLFSRRTSPSTHEPSEHEKFQRLMGIARSLPPRALPALIVGLTRTTQSDLLVQQLEGRGEPSMGPDIFFFKKVIGSELREHRKRVDPASHSLDLRTDILFPWPWHTDRMVDALSYIGRINDNPWKQDFGNHSVSLWLPWNIGFVNGGNHSITTGILMGEGSLVPTEVYDCASLMEVVHTDGRGWFLNGEKIESVRSGTNAAVFEMGRLMAG